jgi:hypothetical protein
MDTGLQGIFFNTKNLYATVHRISTLHKRDALKYRFKIKRVYFEQKSLY